MPQQERDFIGGILDRFMGRTPPSPRPAPPKPPPAITPGTSQYELTKAQDDARNNPAFAPRQDGTTFCNRATCEIVQRMKGPMGALTYPKGEYAVANDAGRYLAIDAKPDRPGQWRVVPPEDAQRLANEGIVVVGVQRNTGRDAQGGHKHGHMATVRPELIPGLAQSLGRAPIVNNIGARRTIEPGETAFREDGGPVIYYTPRRR